MGVDQIILMVEIELLFKIYQDEKYNLNGVFKIFEEKHGCIWKTKKRVIYTCVHEIEKHVYVCERNKIYLKNVRVAILCSIGFEIIYFYYEI